MTVRDLRDVLRERADGPSPANPHRHDEVQSRIRGRRQRRRAVAGMLTGAAAAVAVVVTVSLLPGTPPAETTALTTTGPATAAAERGLPEQFTAPDGTRYRRLGTTEITAEGPKGASITIPVSGRPLDVAALCDGDRNGGTPRVLVNGKPTGFTGFGPCPKTRELLPLILPEGAKKVTVTFDTATAGSGCVKKIKNGPCLRVEEKRADWSLAVYEWTPPVRPVMPEPIKDFPMQLAGKKLASTATGVFPQDDTIELRVVSNTGKIGMDQLCSGDLAGRMRFTFTINGKESPATSGCGVWKQGKFPMAMSEHRIPKGREITITGRIEIRGEHTNRPIAWGVGVYRD